MSLNGTQVSSMGALALEDKSLRLSTFEEDVDVVGGAFSAATSRTKSSGALFFLAQTPATLLTFYVLRLHFAM